MRVGQSIRMRTLVTHHLTDMKPVQTWEWPKDARLSKRSNLIALRCLQCESEPTRQQRDTMLHVPPAAWGIMWFHSRDRCAPARCLGTQ